MDHRLSHGDWPHGPEDHQVGDGVEWSGNIKHRTLCVAVAPTR